MKIKKLLKTVDDADSCLAKLLKVAQKSYRLAQILHELYKILAHF